MESQCKTIHIIDDLDGKRPAKYDSDNATGAGTLSQEYGWFDGVPVAVFLIRTDHIGRPIFATDTNGVKVREASYLPFGGVHVASTDAINLRFPGQWFHASNGLHQNWMRDYDPTTGRYIQADPLGLVAGMNVYGYANQNPGKFVDPNGENPLLAGILVGAALGALFEALDQYMDYGFNFRCWDPYAILRSTVIGGATGALGGAGGGLGLKAGLSGLSNGTKGRIGEGLTRLSNPRLWRNTGSGAPAGKGLSTVTDFTYMKGGVLHVVESKFGKSTLTRAQKAAQRELGNRYHVQRWSYDDFGNMGGGLGGGVAAGLSWLFGPTREQNELCGC